jgi:hypothetical protein
MFLLPLLMASISQITASPRSLTLPTANAGQNSQIISATQARDINGIALGAPIGVVRKMMALTSIGGEQFQGRMGAVDYDLEFTPLGRLFRISSKQILGQFEIDKDFNQTLNRRLATKYGIPRGASIDTRYWRLIQDVEDADGKQHPFVVNWFNVDASRGYDEVELTMTMIDFRYLMADRARLNHQPRNRAEGNISF